MGRPVVVGVEPLEAAMSRMSFFATDLANNAWLKITAMAAVGAVVSGVVASGTTATTAATKTPTTTVAAVGVVVGGGTRSPFLGCRVGEVTGSVRRVEALALLMGDELRIQLRDGDGFDPGGDGCDDVLEIFIETSENVGGEVVVIKFLPRRSHVVRQPYHLAEIIGDGGCPLGGGGQSHAGGNNPGPGLAGMMCLDRRPELGGGGCRRDLREDLLGER